MFGWIFPVTCPFDLWFEQKFIHWVRTGTAKETPQATARPDNSDLSVSSLGV